MHWRRNEEISEGDEIELDRGVMCTVEEFLEDEMTNLNDVLKKTRSPAKDVSSPMRTPALSRPPTQSWAATGNPKSLNALLGIKRTPLGRAVLPTQSPFERRQHARAFVETRSEVVEPPAKKQKRTPEDSPSRFRDENGAPKITQITTQQPLSRAQPLPKSRADIPAQHRYEEVPAASSICERRPKDSEARRVSKLKDNNTRTAIRETQESPPKNFWISQASVDDDLVDTPPSPIRERPVLKASAEVPKSKITDDTTVAIQPHDRSGVASSIPSTKEVPMTRLRPAVLKARPKLMFMTSLASRSASTEPKQITTSSAATISTKKDKQKRPARMETFELSDDDEEYPLPLPKAALITQADSSLFFPGTQLAAMDESIELPDALEAETFHIDGLGSLPSSPRLTDLRPEAEALKTSITRRAPTGFLASSPVPEPEPEPIEIDENVAVCVVASSQESLASFDEPIQLQAPDLIEVTSHRTPSKAEMPISAEPRSPLISSSPARSRPTILEPTRRASPMKKSVSDMNPITLAGRARQPGIGPNTRPRSSLADTIAASNHKAAEAREAAASASGNLGLIGKFGNAVVEEVDEADQGPWGVTALDLFDWWPPGREKPDCAVKVDADADASTASASMTAVQT